MAAVSDLQALAMPWRKSVHSNTTNCVEVALMSPHRPGPAPVIPLAESVAPTQWTESGDL
jgi:hypothetical protein